LELELLEEINCSCPACSGAEDLEQRLIRTPQHDAHIIADQLNALDGIAVPQRVALYEQDLRAASHTWADLERRNIASGGRRRIETWLRTIEIVAGWGFLNPEHAKETLQASSTERLS
jgi:hypothetical protein